MNATGATKICPHNAQTHLSWA